MAVSVRPEAGRIDHLSARLAITRAWASRRSRSICRIGRQAAPNARRRTADARGVVAGRPIPGVRAFGDTFTR